MIAVSNCLLGNNCKYSGGNNYNQTVIDFLKNKEYIGICPEVMGGLSTPRPPSEIVGNKVLTNRGDDVTFEFLQGAKLCLDLCTKNNVTLAILKSNSPSCGNGKIYDGSFSGKIIDGNGLTAKLLLDNNIKVIDEKSVYLLKTV